MSRDGKTAVFADMSGAIAAGLSGRAGFAETERGVMGAVTAKGGPLKNHQWPG
jgi:hypothetical protein